MESHTTPAKIQPNRTVFSLTKAEAICALHGWLTAHGTEVPKGKMAVFFPTYDSVKSFHIALEVHHYDPPPNANGGTE